MFRKLKSQLFANQTEKKLLNASIDKTHNFVIINNLAEIPILMLNPKTKNQLLNFLHKGLSNKSNTLVIKCLIVIHYCLRQNFDEQLNQLLIQPVNEKQNQQTPQTKNPDTNTQVFIKQKIINFYKLYLQKLFTLKQSYEYVKQYVNKTKSKLKKQQLLINHDESMLMICHGFKILNLSHFIFQSQESFNKMGRYYIQYEEIMSVYVQLLTDFNIYNEYINRTVTKIILKYSFLQYQSPKTKKPNVNKINVKNPHERMNISQQENEQIQETKHYFVYVNECQKVADRLYQFYHNRYYYKSVKLVLKFPAFLVLKAKQYKDLLHKTKKVDSKLVYLVRMSKYEKNPNLSKIKSANSITSNDLNKTQTYERNISSAQSDQYNNTQIIEHRAEQKIQETFDEDEELQQENYIY